MALFLIKLQSIQFLYFERSLKDTAPPYEAELLLNSHSIQLKIDDYYVIKNTPPNVLF